LDLGHPGGPAVDRIALTGNAHAIDFPRAMLHDGLDVSFSGLKTSVINYVRKNPTVSTADVAASFQFAVVDVLAAKARKAAQQIGAKTVALGGGVVLLIIIAVVIFKSMKSKSDSSDNGSDNGSDDSDE
jgi:N6-L-threonylcarbamoyladenine synthase